MDDEDILYGVLMGVVEKLDQQGIDIQKTPALYRWSYPMNPDLEFHLLVKRLDEKEQEYAKIQPVSQELH